ncbi:hypothetical protein PAHAL_5G087400 [Panicum hallii]|uniref:Uncharacterized protein n=1 Tax=Panicum hallii TaxID=206008 RepID=A0A2T8IJC1_9POAL|nr:hypothetical protein PAHAL_5G087400 [Panicum hallii]
MDKWRDAASSDRLVHGTTVPFMIVDCTIDGSSKHAARRPGQPPAGKLQPAAGLCPVRSNIVSPYESLSRVSDPTSTSPCSRRAASEELASSHDVRQKDARHIPVRPAPGATEVTGRRQTRTACQSRNEDEAQPVRGIGR